MLKELTIYQKLYDLILYAIPILNKYPKSQRYVLAQQTENTLLEIARLIVEANREHQGRVRLLWQVDGKLEEFRLLIRLAKDLGMLPVKQYGDMAERAGEIGKMLGGWLKQTKAVSGA